MSFDEANALLMQGGAPAVKFSTIGDTVEGTIQTVAVSQQTDFATKEPKTYPDGNPMMQVIVTLETATRDGDDDDGVRRLFAKGAMQFAISEACKKVGADGLAPGGTLKVKYDSNKDTGKGNPAKQYVAKYDPPTAGEMLAQAFDADTEPF